MNQVRVRFAPSPTGGLHLGGVRTVLYNYLFARKHGGTFILRIEDTDQNRYVPGAEEYIFDCLEWCGLSPDESVRKPGAFGPYRQSERKDIYRQYAEQLVAQGHAYYAFDTPEEIDEMRQAYRVDEYSTAQYDHRTRMKMKNSLTLSAEETNRLLHSNTPYVIRIRVPESEHIRFTDLIRGDIEFMTQQVDDKVLLKADGMPTYHLAVVVDDYLMQITHVFRGEEWLPSAPVHLLLWKFLGWEKQMPQWAHLPLILKPDGHGKLSKRDGDRLGFPVFAMNWKDPQTNETALGFKEYGFLPDAFVNMLALLGWNPGVEKEVFSMEEMVEAFSLERVHKSGAKFDFEKAKWFNHQYIQQLDNAILLPKVRPFFPEAQAATDNQLIQVIGMVKERCSLLADFRMQGLFFFQSPASLDTASLLAKWNDITTHFFQEWIKELMLLDEWSEARIESSFNDAIQKCGMKKGEAMLPFRIMLVGGKYGPGVFAIASFIGKEACIERMQTALRQLH